MARITVEDCIDKFQSRFELVLVASNRARKLHAGESPTVEIDNDKHTVIALREIAEETIDIDQMKNNLVEEYQSVSAIDEEELSLEYTESEDDQNFKESIKTFSNWPTIPQLYVKGDFVGGCDIVKEMFETGELLELLNTKGIDVKT